MDVGNRNGWRMKQVVPSRELLKVVEKPLAPSCRSAATILARWLVATSTSTVRERSVSSRRSPNRFAARAAGLVLSADGVLYTCLFATNGTDLREPLRNGADDDEVSEILARTWLQRADRYSELRRTDIAEAHHFSKVEMYRIGG